MISFLILEDDDNQRDLYEMLIRMSYSDAHIDHAANGMIALEKARALDYTVIICDINVPLLNGVEFYEKLKEERPILARRTVFISGDIHNPEYEFIFEETRPHLAKPFKKEDFYKLLSYVISQEEEKFLVSHETKCKRQNVRFKAAEECSVVPFTQAPVGFQDVRCNIINHSIDGLSVQHEQEWSPGTEFTHVFANRFNISAKKARIVWTRSLNGSFQSGLQWV